MRCGRINGDQKLKKKKKRAQNSNSPVCSLQQKNMSPFVGREFQVNLEFH